MRGSISESIIKVHVFLAVESCTGHVSSAGLLEKGSCIQGTDVVIIVVVRVFEVLTFGNC